MVTDNGYSVVIVLSKYPVSHDQLAHTVTQAHTTIMILTLNTHNTLVKSLDCWLRLHVLAKFRSQLYTVVAVV